MSGGRILGLGFRDNRHADGLRRFIRGEPGPHAPARTRDGRAVYYPAPEDLPADLGQLVDAPRTAGEQLTDEIPERSFRHARQTEIRDARLWIDGDPRLLAAMGGYSVGTLEDAARDLKTYREMGLNAVVAYVDSTLPSFHSLARGGRPLEPGTLGKRIQARLAAPAHFR